MIRAPFPHAGLYAITDAPALDGRSLEDAVAAAISGGARVVQYRDKSDDHQRRRQEASALLEICHRRRVPLIINDDPGLAIAIGADGVHLGRGDGDPAQVRESANGGFIIGVSCYNQASLAHDAVKAGADYIAYGSFYPSLTKPDAVSADLALVENSRSTIPVPIVAIGGITAENGAALLEAGVDLLAVVSGIFAAPNPEAAAVRYARLFQLEKEGNRT
jgi:thiamine-phosphate pyrophosphorylase